MNEYKLSDILYERKIYATKNDIYPHVTLAKDGIYNKTDRFDRDFLVKDKEKKYKITKTNDICYNPANLKFGVICLNTYGNAIFSPIYVTLELKETLKNKVDIKYLSYILTSKDFIEKARRYEQGTVYERMAVGVDDFLKMKIILPDILEQKTIVKKIENIEKIIEAKKQIIKNKELEKKYYMEVIFQNKEKKLISENINLGRLLEFQNGINADAEKYGQGIKYISVMDILNNTYITYENIKGLINIEKNIQDNYKVSYGDILFVRSSENLIDAGKSNVYLDKDKDAVFGGFVIRGKKKENYNPIYLKYALESYNVRKQLMKYAAGNQHVNIGQESLKKINIPYLNIEKQNTIAKIFSNFDNEIELIFKEIFEYEILKKGLMQQLLTGKVRTKI